MQLVHSSFSHTIVQIKQSLYNALHRHLEYVQKIEGVAFSTGEVAHLVVVVVANIAGLHRRQRRKGGVDGLNELTERGPLIQT